MRNRMQTSMTLNLAKHGLPSAIVETLHLQAKQAPPPSPWMGEGGDGGERFADVTPTCVLPRTQRVPEGGEFFRSGFQPTSDKPSRLQPEVDQFSDFHWRA